MNRNKEYTALIKEIEKAPAALDYTYTRACARRNNRKNSRIVRWIYRPIGCLVAAFAMFAMLVNLFPSVAYAAGRVPLIAELAQFVAASPSLKAAVDNQYVQPIEQEQTVNGITARIEYAIVDQKQLNVFYTLDSDAYSCMRATPKIRDIAGNSFKGYTMSSSGMDEKNGGLRKFTVDFIDLDMPSELVLCLKIHDNGTIIDKTSEPRQNVNEDMLSTENHQPDIISEVEFTLSIDPYYTAQGEKVDLNTVLDIDGQRLTLVSAEIYPTHMRFTFDDFEDNTAWLKSLEFYVENEQGERFESIADGITASGKPDSPMMATHRLESSFFSESKQLTLHITGVTWLSKDMERIHVDLVNCTADTLPDGVRLESTKKYEDGWIVAFSAPQFKEGHHYQLFGSYFDKKGEEFYFNSSTSSGDEKGHLDMTLALSDYVKNEAWLSPIFSHVKTLDSPIATKIK